MMTVPVSQIVEGQHVFYEGAEYEVVSNRAVRFDYRRFVLVGESGKEEIVMLHDSDSLELL